MIYVCSRASILERGEMWRKYRSLGWEINSSWIDLDKPGQISDFSTFWSKIEDEIRECTHLIFYATEEGDFPLKGVLVEIGMALALNKQVFIVTPGIEIDHSNYRPLGSWSAHPNIKHFDTLDEAFSNTKE